MFNLSAESGDNFHEPLRNEFLHFESVSFAHLAGESFTALDERAGLKYNIR